MSARPLLIACVVVGAMNSLSYVWSLFFGAVATPEEARLIGAIWLAFVGAWALWLLARGD